MVSIDGVQYSRQVFRALDTHGSGGITFTVIDDTIRFFSFSFSFLLFFFVLYILCYS